MTETAILAEAAPQQPEHFDLVIVGAGRAADLDDGSFVYE